MQGDPSPCGCGAGFRVPSGCRGLVGCRAGFWGSLGVLRAVGSPLVLWDECLGLLRSCLSPCCGAGLWGSPRVQWGSPGVSWCCSQDLGVLWSSGDPSPCGLWAGTFRDAVTGGIPWCSGMWGRILGFPEGPL